MFRFAFPRQREKPASIRRCARRGGAFPRQWGYAAPFKTQTWKSATRVPRASGDKPAHWMR
ncbi:hypothetical protein ACLB1Q_29015 [Escherichia coli]